MEDREAVTPGKKFPRRKVEKYFQKLQKNGTELYGRRRKGLTVAGGSVCRQRRKPVYGRLYIGRTGKISQVRLDKVDLR